MNIQAEPTSFPCFECRGEGRKWLLPPANLDERVERILFKARNREEWLRQTSECYVCYGKGEIEAPTMKY